MDNKFQPSFIPKKPLIGADVASHKAPISVFGLIGLILFILSILAAGGSYFWVNLLKKQEAQNEATLKAARDAFNPALIDELKKVDTRMTVAQDLLSKHLALSGFFELLQSLTLKSVRFTSLTYTYNPTDSVQVTLSGEADSFASVALQSDVIGKDKHFHNTVVNDIQLMQNGHISFLVVADVDSSVFSYGNIVAPQAEASSTNDSLLTTPLNLPQQ